MRILLILATVSTFIWASQYSGKHRSSTARANDIASVTFSGDLADVELRGFEDAVYPVITLKAGGAWDSAIVEVWYDGSTHRDTQVPMVLKVRSSCQIYTTAQIMCDQLPLSPWPMSPLLRLSRDTMDRVILVKVKLLTTSRSFSLAK